MLSHLRQRRSRPAAIAAAVLLQTLAGCTPNGSSSAGRVDGGATDAGSFRVSTEVTVGDTEGPGVLCHATPVARLPGGGVAVTGCDCGTVVLFGPDGAFRRRVGSCGEGPGELRHVRSIFAHGSSLFLTGSPRRVVEYDLASGALRAEHTLPRLAEIAGVLPDGTRVLRYMDPVQGNLVHGLHLHAPSGARVASLYAVRAEGDRQVWVDAAHTVNALVTPGGEIWTVRPANRYEVRAWGADGRLRRSFDREADWFPPYPEPWTGLRPRATAIAWVDDTLLVVGQTPTEWVDGPLFRPGESFASPQEVRRILSERSVDIDTVVEAIDPETGATVALGRFPALSISDNTGGFGGIGGDLFRFRSDEAGNIRVEALRGQVIGR